MTGTTRLWESQQKDCTRKAGVACKKLWFACSLETDGQDLIEYALLAGFISLVSLTWLINLGSTTNGLYGNLNSTVNAIP